MALFALPVSASAQTNVSAARRNVSSAQTNVPSTPTNFPIVQIPGGPQVILKGGTVQFVGANEAPGAPTPNAAPAAVPPPVDPLLNLMLSQPAIDTQAPVIVEAEFEPPVVTAGSRATYRLILTALSDTIELPAKLPAPPGLDVQPGARSQTFHRPGAVMQARSTFNFRARAAAPGTYVMPSYSVTVSGKPVSVAEKRLQVLPPGAPLPAAAAELALELPQPELFVGQSVPAKLTLTDRNIGQVMALSQAQVSHDAFLSDAGYGRLRGDVSVRDGRPLTTFISEVLLTPIRAGTFALIGQTHVVQNPVHANRFPAIPAYNALLDTDPVTVTVRPVPAEHQLPGFTGAIGVFEADPPQLASGAVVAGEPVTLNLTLRGEGNFGRFLAPKPQSSRDWQVFPARTVVANAGNQLQHHGFATFSYTLVPVSPQVTATPSMPFSYFDPDTRRHVALTIPSVPIKVTAAPGGVASQPPLPEPPAPAPPASDELTAPRPLILTGLAERPGWRVNSLRPVQARPWFGVLLCLPGVALVGLWLRDRRRRYLERHPEAIRKRHARRAVARELRRVRRAVASGDATAFITAAVGALRAASAPHEGANPEALVAGDVLAGLPALTGNGHDAEVVRRLFAAADALRFAGRAPDGVAVLAVHGELERVVARLRRRL
jgi:hypothetical protein